jgi:hypothetical protein
MVHASGSSWRAAAHVEPVVCASASNANGDTGGMWCGRDVGAGMRPLTDVGKMIAMGKKIVAKVGIFSKCGGFIKVKHV